MSEAAQPTVKRLRWARDADRIGTYQTDYDRRWHREGIAELVEGEPIHFCGAYHPGECQGRCGLPRLVRTRPDGVRERALVAMGICAAYVADLEHAPWDGLIIEVDHPGSPTWR